MHTGTPLEVKKRQACIPLLYIMTFLWISQIAWAGKRFSHSLSVLPRTVRCLLPHVAYLSTYTVPAHIHLQAAHPSSGAKGFPAYCTPSTSCCAVYGTAIVHNKYPGCWTGPDKQSVVHIAQSMTYSTWAFTALLMYALTSLVQPECKASHPAAALIACQLTLCS